MTRFNQNNRYRSLINKILTNRLAGTCIAILTLTVLLSIFAYIIIPDRSVNANRQILDLSLQRPGTAQTVLVVSDNHPKKATWTTFVNGEKNSQRYFPADTYEEEEGLLTINYGQRTKYISVGDQTQVQPTTITYYLGSDRYGRDILSRLVLGLRFSLVVGFLAVMLSLTIGIFVGCLGGYFGGWIDRMIMLVINTSWSIPTILMAFAIIIALGKGFLVVVFAVGLTMWVDVARLVRGQVMEVKSQLYVQASQVLGFSDWRTIVIHILPNISGPILVMAAANFATAILVEAGLSYLGLGIQPPTPSLGNMLKDGYNFATGGFVYLAVFPVLTIMTLVLTFNLLGTSLRDIFDVQSNKR